MDSRIRHIGNKIEILLPDTMEDAEQEEIALALKDALSKQYIEESVAQLKFVGWKEGKYKYVLEDEYGDVCLVSAEGVHVVGMGE